MPQQVVFPCPSCGATLSVDQGVTSTQCQFCGSTVAVPGAIGAAPPQPAPPAPTPMYVPYAAPIYTPAVPDTNRIWRGVLGLNLFITGAVVILTLCIMVAAMLPFIVFMIPGFWSGLAQFLNQLTTH